MSMMRVRSALVALLAALGANSIELRSSIQSHNKSRCSTEITEMKEKRSEIPGLNFKSKSRHGARNPAGCANIQHDSDDLALTAGMFPVEDFKKLLTEKPSREGGSPMCKKINQRFEWCPEPAVTPYLGRDTDLVKEVEVYLKQELINTDPSRPLAVAFTDHVHVDAKGFQVMNFLCGWGRLGLVENRSALFVPSADAAEAVRKLHPNARVLYHDSLPKIVSLMSDKTKLDYTNRLWKMAIAHILVNMGRDIILADMDVYWVRDPTPLFEQEAHNGLELAAMKDLCWLELNSGFLFYRSTETVKYMLQVAATTIRDPEIRACRDNDQYLLNCGFARAATRGLNYRILPPAEFTFGTSPKLGGNLRCHASEGGTSTVMAPASFGDGLPYIWHTSGFSGNYVAEIDMFASVGAIDVDGQTLQCKPGLRGQDADASQLVEMSAKACQIGAGGIANALCVGDCKVDPKRADALVNDFVAAFTRQQ